MATTITRTRLNVTVIRTLSVFFVILYIFLVTSDYLHVLFFRSIRRMCWLVF